MISRRTTGVLILIVALATGIIASTASVAAAPPTTFTIIEKDVTETFRDDEGICGVTGLVTITYNFVLHVTEFSDGRVHVTGTLTGTVLLEGDDGVTYTGHFTQWFGENSNNRNFAATFTFSVNLKGDDGSRLRLNEVAHFSTNANGEMTVEFDKINCN